MTEQAAASGRRAVREPAAAARVGGGSPGSGTAVVGLQWGDEGKGKVIDLLADGFDAVVRYNGGANAGHSVVIDGVRHALHLVPSGVFRPRCRPVIANGVVVDPIALVSELAGLVKAGVDVSDVALSDRAHLVMPYHKEEDGLRERALSAGRSGAAEDEVAEDRSIGTTKRGIGPAYAEKANRSTAVRARDLLDPAELRRKVHDACALRGPLFERLGGDPPDVDAIAEAVLEAGTTLRPHITDTVYLLHEMLGAGKRLLFEGANATLLDVDHGTYPFVTSSNCSVLGIPAGTGVPPHRIGAVTGVLKAYGTRVGAGPFPTEQAGEVGDRIREAGNEYGTTTGRPRRCGWLDLVAARYAAMLNGTTTLAVMLLDVLAGLDELRVCTAYRVGGEETGRFPADARALERVEPVYETMAGFAGEVTTATSLSDLPPGARVYLDRIEEYVGVPVGIVSVGPDRAQTIEV